MGDSPTPDSQLIFCRTVTFVDNSRYVEDQRILLYDGLTEQIAQERTELAGLRDRHLAAPEKAICHSLVWSIGRQVVVDLPGQVRATTTLDTPRRAKRSSPPR